MINSAADLVSKIASLDKCPAAVDFKCQLPATIQMIWEKVEKVGKDKATSMIEKQISKGSYSLDEATELLERMISKSNRVRMVFDTQAELDAFAKNNTCGSDWIDEDGKFCCYKY